jgi:3-deoxy-D-manno-octulosonic-acid transferase
MRLGILPAGLNLDRPIWIHAVSVGEAIAVRGLLEGLRKSFPGKKFVISTVTSTGNKIAGSLAAKDDAVIYLPLDFSFVTKGVINKINPALFIIAETEIWPNLISSIYEKEIPIVVVNGRISDRSFKGYSRIKFLVKPILNKIRLFCVQSLRDSERLTSLGVPGSKIKISGNMKFDIEGERKIDTSIYKLKLGLETKEKLFLAGSTHAHEEEVILGAYKKLLNEFPSLRLMIAPRHPERSAEVTSLIEKSGFLAQRISLLKGQALKPDNAQRIFILDTVGELIEFYNLADIVFVGGSLAKIGGHNILEPASCAKPVMFGPHMFNFRDIADLFLANKAAILVHNQKEIEAQVKYLLSDASVASELNQRAKEIIAQNKGATARNIELIRQVGTA